MPAVSPASKRRLSVQGSARARGSHAKKLRTQAAGGLLSDAVAALGPSQHEMMMAVHQFGVVGGSDYDSKEHRLEQLLDRLPANGGKALIFAKAATAAEVSAVVERCRKKAATFRNRRCGAGRFVGSAAGASAEAGTSSPAKATATADCVLDKWTCGGCTFVNEHTTEFCTVCEMGRFPLPSVIVAEADCETLGKGVDPGSCNIIINYDLPGSGRDYVRRLSVLQETEPRAPAPPRVAYTFVTEEELQNRQCHEVVKLLKYTRKCAKPAKAAEFDSQLAVLGLFDGDGEEDEDEEEDDDADGLCECMHCRGNMLGSISHHALMPSRIAEPSTYAGVEVVRIPLRALADLDRVAPFIAPRVLGHSCTIICLHCLFCHTPWDGWEQFFAPPDFMGTMRVVLLLAEAVSWHDYPDAALLCAGGSSWIDILDMDSMDRTDALIEQLVDHEIALLEGRSERLVLMGMSQGGGQSMLRFLRSHRRLGGWIGSVCHVPTAPHTPRNRDPLLSLGRQIVNCDRPIRLLAGESDIVFPPGLVTRDAARLRDVGGFTDVQVEVRRGLCHEGPNGEVEQSSPAKTPKSPNREDAIRTAPRPLRRDAASQAAAYRRAVKQKPELLFLQQHLPSMVNLTPSSVPELA